MKITAAIAVMLCSFLTGRELFRRRNRSCELLSHAAEFCLFMQNCIRYEQSAPEEIIRAYSSGDVLFKACITEIGNGKNFAEAWEIQVQENAGFLSREESDLIMQLGTGLGRTDVSGELLRLGRIYSGLDELCRRRSAGLENERRLYLSVSLLSGAFITLMML